MGDYMRTHLRLAMVVVASFGALSMAQTVSNRGQNLRNSPIREMPATKSTSKDFEHKALNKNLPEFNTKKIDLKGADTANDLLKVLKSGPDVTGGGDTLVMNFKLGGKKVCDYLQATSENNRFGINPEKFCFAVDKVKVTSQESTFLDDGTEVDAINNPAKLEIKLSQERNFSKYFKEIIQLAAHEYVSVIGMNDKNYQISGPLTLRMDISEDPNPEIGECMQINAQFSCEDNENQVVTIKSNGNQYTMDGLAFYTKNLFVANGQEQRVAYDPAGPDRDVAYEAFIKAQCFTTGFEIQTRNNDFWAKDESGKYKLGGYSSAVHRVVMAPDSSRFILFSKGRSTDILTGKITESEGKTRCKKIN